MQTSEQPVEVEQKRKVLHRVLESRTFSRCDQLKQFLAYVCELEFAGRSAEIHEYLIGIEALGRPKDFSPQDDSTVRTRAHSLRQKLQEYYQHENPDAAIRIELPKGSYVPVFVSVREPIPDNAAPALDAVGLAHRLNKRRIPSLGIAFALGAAVMGMVWMAVAWVAPRKISPAKLDPIVAEAWGPLAQPDANVAVSVSTPPHLHLQSLAESPAGLPYHNPPLLPATPEITAFYETFRLSKPGTPVYMWRTTNSTLLGITLGVAEAVKTLTLSGASFEVIPEKGASHPALCGRNIMRFGSPLDSAEIAFDLSRVPLSIHFAPAIGDVVISGRLSGKPEKVFIPKRESGISYGLLTVMPTEDSGGLARTVIASGVTSAGTHAAIAFFRSAEHLRDLKARFQGEGHRTFPPAYQVVVQCGYLNAVQVSFSYVAHTALQ